MKLDTNWTQRNEIAERRLSICNTCESYDATLKQCKECYCFMEFKARLMSTKCPLGKWDKETL